MNASEIVLEGLRLLEQREREDRARIEWLRSATKEAADSIDRREGSEFEIMHDLAKLAATPASLAAPGTDIARLFSAR